MKMNHIKIDPIIRERYSPRIYTDQIPDERTLLTLFEAARWAASARNSQPWRFIYGVYHDEHWKKLYDCLSESNQTWARKVPVLIFALIKTMDLDTGRKIGQGEYSLGLAVGNLTFQAYKLGLGLRNMGGFDPEIARKSFNLPDHFTPAVMISVGYPGNPETDDQNLMVPVGAQRHRRNLDQIIFNHDWNLME
jgi:nitroreductase